MPELIENRAWQVRAVRRRKSPSTASLLSACASCKWLTSLVLALAGFLLLQALLPLVTAVQIGADEGFELAKATLWLKGHGLYTEAWNDQPPLHTFLVVQVLKHLLPGVLGARLVTVIAATVLLAGVFSITCRVSGPGVAGLTVMLLTVSPGFLELSASCMLEIPALAPAVLALGVLCHAGVARVERQKIGVARSELGDRGGEGVGRRSKMEDGRSKLGLTRSIGDGASGMSVRSSRGFCSAWRR